MGMPGDHNLRLLLEQLDPGAAGTFTWLDPRNASLALLPNTAAVPVRVLLELRGRRQLVVLVTSQEGMSPAPTDLCRWTWSGPCGNG